MKIIQFSFVMFIFDFTASATEQGVNDTSNNQRLYYDEKFNDMSFFLTQYLRNLEISLTTLLQDTFALRQNLIGISDAVQRHSDKECGKLPAKTKNSWRTISQVSIPTSTSLEACFLASFCWKADTDSQTLETLCAMECGDNPQCRSFTIADNVCRLYETYVIPSGTSNTDNTLIFTNETFCGPNVALNKPAYGTTWEGYPSPKTTTRGFTCPKGEFECWSSTNPPDSTLKIDLEGTFTIRKVVITASGRWNSFSSDFFIHIGDRGDASDPIFAKQSNISPFKGERMVFTGQQDGKFIFIERHHPQKALVICLVEAYEN